MSRLPLWLASDDQRTIRLAVCRNCGKTKATSSPCGFDHLAAVMEFATCTQETDGWQPGDVVRDESGCMWWRWWDNSGWEHLLHFPGWHGDCDVDDAAPVEPLTLLLRDAQPVVGAP